MDVVHLESSQNGAVDTMIDDNRQTRMGVSRLRWQWLKVATLYAAGVLLGYRFVQQVWRTDDAAQWFGLATAVMIAQMGILWWVLPYNHRRRETRPRVTLGYGNGLTLTRGLGLCLLAGFLFAPPPTGLLAWAPAVLYTLDRLIDYVDGYVARVTKNETKLGEILDMEFDGLGILIAILLGIQYGKLPAWYLILGFSRQLFVLGMWLRRRQGLPVLDLPPSDYRRLVAGFQTGFMTVMLWPVLTPEITLLASYLFAIPLTYSFGRDWLVISTVIDADSPRYLRTRAAVKRVLEGWLPLAARLVAVVLALLLFAHSESAVPLWVVTPVALLLLFGVVGRVAALAMFGLAAVDILSGGLRWFDNGLLLVCSIIVIHLGSGRFALWQPEERLIRLKLGATEPEPP